MAIKSYGYTLTWPGAGSPGRAVWHYRIDEPFVGDDQDIVDALNTFYIGVLDSGLLAPPYTVDGDSEVIDVQTKQIEPVTGGLFQSAGPAVDFNPTGQMVVTLRTSSATRSGRGRKFLGPVIAGAANTEGTLDQGLVTAVQNAANALLATSVGFSGAAIGVWSPTQNLFRDMVAVQARNYCAVLRSRRD